jgi:hypothetical protein
VVGIQDQAVLSEKQRQIAGLEYMAEQNSDSVLGARLDSPKETSISGFPVGTSYFCHATYNKDDQKRNEYWEVVYGSSLADVNIEWESAERLAKDERENEKTDSHGALKNQLQHLGEVKVLGWKDQKSITSN